MSSGRIQVKMLCFDRVGWKKSELQMAQTILTCIFMTNFGLSYKLKMQVCGVRESQHKLLDCTTTTDQSEIRTIGDSEFDPHHGMILNECVIIGELNFPLRKVFRAVTQIAYLPARFEVVKMLS